jgi:hypothetical protein
MILQDLNLYKNDGKYYLSAKLDHEDKAGFYEVSIPKIYLPVSSDIAVSSSSSCYGNAASIDFGFATLAVEPYDDNHFFTITCLEEKVHKMTLAEIERELGYKVEIQEENNHE